MKPKDNALFIGFTNESICILSADESLEYAYWTRDEWVEDSEVVFSIAGAIRDALINPTHFKRICNDHGMPIRLD